jgi:hypothetical protein
MYESGGCLRLSHRLPSMALVRSPAVGEPAGYDDTHLMVFSRRSLGVSVWVEGTVTRDLLSIIGNVLCKEAINQLLHDTGVFWETVKLALEIGDVVVDGLSDSRHVLQVTIGVAVGELHAGQWATQTYCISEYTVRGSELRISRVIKSELFEPARQPDEKCKGW